MIATDFFGGRECTLSLEFMRQLLQMSASYVRMSCAFEVGGTTCVKCCNCLRLQLGPVRHLRFELSVVCAVSARSI